MLCGIRVAAESGSGDEELLGRVDFVDEGRVEMGNAFGSELDGRLYTPLEGLDQESLVTPEGRFYLRTMASRILPDSEGWTIAVDGLMPLKRSLRIVQFRAREKALGQHLLECAGNTRAVHFGMISVGDWAGVPITELLQEWKPSPSATRVLVSGFDKYAANSATSLAGASWIFTFEELHLAGAFLATKLNGKPLSRDHGAPVRLVVPGWYGCTCIKWVNAIEFVDSRVAPTGQMVEFAARTHQRGVPGLARDFSPATIDHAALPVRVEHWSIDGRSVYRVTGILWGGNKPSNALEIRFRSDLPFVRVSDCPLPKSTRTWSLWTHEWTPAAPGRYEISLRMADDTIRTRRLDLNFYRRTVTIESV